MTETSEVARLRFALMAAEYVERIGKRIRERRDELGLSRAEVARLMPGKTNENAIYRWEKGRHRANDDALEALAEVLEVDVSYFLEPNGETDETPDLMGAVSADSNGDLETRVARVETKLDQLIELVTMLAPDQTELEEEVVRLAEEEAERTEQRRDEPGEDEPESRPANR